MMSKLPQPYTAHVSERLHRAAAVRTQAQIVVLLVKNESQERRLGGSCVPKRHEPGTATAVAQRQRPEAPNQAQHRIARTESAPGKA